MRSRFSMSWVIAGLGAVLVVAIAGVYYFEKPKAAPTLSSGAVATSTATTTTTMVGGIAINTAGGATIKEIPIPNAASVPAPSFKTPLTFLASLQLSPDVQTLLQQKYTADVATLSANAVDFDAWIDLGEARKLGGDYAGAAADWEYVSVIYPKNIVSFANLGDLYTNFLPNYPKAAANYEHEIANNPAYEDSYSDLFSLFTNQYPQGTTTPQNVLKEGIAASPQSVDLYVLLARYYVSKGDTADAKIEYQVAIAQAQAQNDSSVAAQIKAEAASL